MGYFVYDGTIRAEFADRLLAHLQVVIGTKLRRGEPFYFTWSQDRSEGGGRTAIWVNPASGLQYRYASGRRPAFNLAWIEALALEANSRSGLFVVDEPEPDEPCGERLPL